MDRINAPYAPPENVLRVLDRWRKIGFPNRLNSEYYTQLGIPEQMATRVHRALEYLGLVEGNVQTARAEQLQVAPDDEWRSVLADAIFDGYAEVFKVVDPSTASRKQVDDAFRPMKPSGQRNRMVTLFLGLLHAAGIDVKEPPSQRAGKGEARKDRVLAPKAKNGKASSPVALLPTERLALPPAGRLHPAVTGVLQAVGELETLDDLERWIESFRATFKMVKKV